MDSNQPVNQEAAKATDITQAAHRLLFGEAVFQVVHGYYLISNDDAHKLAALHLLSEIGAGQPDPSVRCVRQIVWLNRYGCVPCARVSPACPSNVTSLVMPP